MGLREKQKKPPNNPANFQSDVMGHNYKAPPPHWGDLLLTWTEQWEIYSDYIRHK